MAYSREIIKKVLQYVRFRVPQTEEKNSYYTEISNTLVRISNHCTRLRVWDDILEKNPKWKGKPIISIVFEDNEDTFDEVDCLALKRYRMKPIKVTEYVYRLQGDPQLITPQDEQLIINGIKQIQNGRYTDATNKCAEPILRVSQNPPSTPPNNRLNCNLNMNKKLIRLTESDLHKIVKELVLNVLNESTNDMTRKEEIKQAADSMGLYQAGAAMFQLGAEWADEHPNYPNARTMFLKVCYFLDKYSLLNNFDWGKMSLNFQKYIDTQG